MQYLTAATTNTGFCKSINQDSYLVKHVMMYGKEALLLVLCDGMGGFQRGELASAEAVHSFEEWFEDRLPGILKHDCEDEILLQWTRLMQMLNLRLYQYGVSQGMRIGTTCTAVLYIDASYWIVHVGDCRFYELHDDVIHKITTDHTFVEEAVRTGVMTAEQARHDCRRNLLTKCLGGTERLEADVVTGRMKTGVYLLCSDGFWHENSDGEIVTALRDTHSMDREYLRNTLEEMSYRALRRGEQDNLTAIAVRSCQSMQSESSL